MLHPQGHIRGNSSGSYVLLQCVDSPTELMHLKGRSENHEMGEYHVRDKAHCFMVTCSFTVIGDYNVPVFFFNCSRELPMQLYDHVGGVGMRCC